eukprot:TRINITY_DN7397_c0_g1_i4.p1 TRINITY_DN7397_c0_g1~~TRINITY_DN7397_c0_g1_i4.p1  ORF type:complete len:680 (+),score=243.97 TRINITY_DN7397_c0_g1_i4:216-2255(+)
MEEIVERGHSKKPSKKQRARLKQRQDTGGSANGEGTPVQSSPVKDPIPEVAGSQPEAVLAPPPAAVEVKSVESPVVVEGTKPDVSAPEEPKPEVSVIPTDPQESVNSAPENISDAPPVAETSTAAVHSSEPVENGYIMVEAYHAEVGNEDLGGHERQTKHHPSKKQRQRIAKHNPESTTSADEQGDATREIEIENPDKVQNAESKEVQPTPAAEKPVHAEPQAPAPLEAAKPEPATEDKPKDREDISTLQSSPEEEKVAQLREENAKLQDELTALKHLEGERDKLLAKQVEDKSVTEEMRAEVLNLRGSADELKNSMKDLEAKLQEEKKKTASVEELLVQETSLRTKVESELATEKSDSKSKIAELEALLKEKQEKTVEAMKQAEQEKVKSESLDSKVGAISMELQDLKLELSRERDETAGALKLLEKEKHSNKELEANLSTLSEELKKVEDSEKGKVASLEMSLCSLKAELAATKENANAVEKENATLKNDVQNLKSSAPKQEELTKAKAALNNALEEKAAAEAAAAQDAGNAIKLVDELRMLKLKASGFQERSSIAEAAVQESTKARGELQGKLAQAQSKVSSLEKELNVLKNKIENGKTTAEKPKLAPAAPAQANEKLKEAEKKLQQLQSEKLAAEKQLKDVQQQLAHQTAYVKQSQALLASIRSDLAAVRSSWTK